MTSLPLATVIRIAKDNTGVSRVGEDSGKLLVNLATDYIKAIATEAGKIAVHAGRSTIREDDIQFVLTNGL